MKQTAIVTGASRGIGLALTKILLKNNYEVIGTSRYDNLNEISDDNFKLLRLDLSKIKSIEACQKEIGALTGNIDLLVNNAALGTDLNLKYPEWESFEQTFEVNLKGTVFFTESLLKSIREGGMLLNISSKMGSINECKSPGSVAYRMSKSALNMYTKILSIREKDRINVASIHPGWVRTNISKGNENAPLSPEESATKILKFIKRGFTNGIYYDVESDKALPW